MSNLGINCNEFELNNGMGLCKKLDCVCRCFYCDVISSCSWIQKCSELNLTEVKEAEVYYRSAARKLRDIIRSKARLIPQTELIGGLLCRREEAILRALTNAPGDIVEVKIVQKHIELSPDIQPSDLTQTDRFVEFFNYLVFLDLFEDKIKKIENGDMKVFATTKGLKQFQNMTKNTRKYIEDIIHQMNATSKKEPTIDEHNNIIFAWSKQMAEPLSWCQTNDVPVEISGMHSQAELNEILKHMEDIGEQFKNGVTSFCLDKQLCYERSFDIYNALIPAIKCLHDQSAELRSALNSLESSATKLSMVFKKQLSVENWESIVLDAYVRFKSRNYLFDCEIPQIDDWQTRIADGAFWASTLLFSFIFTNRGRIIQNSLSRGWVFEERLRTELIDRTVEVSKNFPTPFGDIDFLAKKNDNIFAIEAKDYAPWYKDWYIGYRIFNARKTVLKRRVNRLSKRIEWLNKNPDKAGIYKNPRPICISRYNEDFIEFGIGFNKPQLDQLFGNSKYASYKETLPKYKIVNGFLETQILKRRIERGFYPNFPYENYQLFFLCPSFPQCVTQFIISNPWLIGCDQLKEICSVLQKNCIGVSCEHFTSCVKGLGLMY